MKVPPFLRKSPGFTVIEVLSVLMVVSALVRMGIPGFQEVRLRAEAAQVVGDFQVVKYAVAEFSGEHHTWPRDYGPGQIPPELIPYLPEGFSFNRGRYRLDWDHWVLPQGLPLRPEVRGVVGLSVSTSDPALGAALAGLLGSSFPHFVVGNTYTFLLEAF